MDFGSITAQNQLALIAIGVSLLSLGIMFPGDCCAASEGIGSRS